MATEQTVIPAPTKAVISHPRAQKIDVAKALKLRLQGNTFDEIGLIFDCNGSAVHQALSKFECFLKDMGPGELTAYSEHRSELFNRVEQTLTASLLDGDKIQKASLNNVAYAFKQIHEARRLESGQSTENISILGKLITQAESKLGAPAVSTQTKQAPPQAEPES